MRKSQGTFGYSTEQLSRLQKTISAERLAPYATIGQDDLRYAVKLYEWNTALSEAFYGILQCLEISIRNTMHDLLCQQYQRDDWYEVCPFQPIQAKALADAKNRILKSGKSVAPGRIVAELTFGFWVALLGPSYAAQMWNKCLYQMFLQHVERHKVYARLEKIRKLRNRVAHHESILARELQADYVMIVETVHWICPVTAKWLTSHNCFYDRFRRRPLQQFPTPLFKEDFFSDTIKIPN